MNQIIEGIIVSTQLAIFGSQEIVYGYLGIRTQDGEKKVVKIDSYTWYETLEMGSEVIIEVVNLGTTDILVARKISMNSNAPMNEDQRAVAIT